MSKNTKDMEKNESEIVAEFVIGEDGKITTEAKEDTTTKVIVREDGTVETETVVATEEKTDLFEGMHWQPYNFVKNLEYMGKGMLGIFAVIGIIIVSVYLLAKIGIKKRED